MVNPLRRDNPYRTANVIEYDEGDLSLERFRILYRPSNNDKLHTVIYGDTLWSLAFDYYKNSKLWWVIADVNPSIEHPMILTTNTNIIIPDIIPILS